MPDTSPSPGFLDKLSQRVRGQRKMLNFPSKDTNLPYEPKKKKGFIEEGSTADKVKKGFDKFMSLGKK